MQQSIQLILQIPTARRGKEMKTAKGVNRIIVDRKQPSVDHNSTYFLDERVIVVSGNNVKFKEYC